jgi:hypothetical protein
MMASFQLLALRGQRQYKNKGPPPCGDGLLEAYVGRLQGDGKIFG